MSNKKNEDLEKRAGEGGNDFGGEKDPFLGRNNSAMSHRPRRDTGFSAYFDKLDHSPGASILAYCLASISMTVVNKYVVSGSEWNLNFFYLAVQVWRRCNGRSTRQATDNVLSSLLFARSRFCLESRRAC